jgi:hypothetical protein
LRIADAHASRGKNIMPNDQHFRVQYTIRLPGNVWRIQISDLIFSEGLPVLVLEWHDLPNTAVPRVSVKLDPARLQEFRSGDVTHLYDGYIEAPQREPDVLQQALALSQEPR